MVGWVGGAGSVTEVDADLAPLCELYYRSGSAEDLAGMTPGRLVEAVRSHLRLAQRRVAGRPVVRISDDTGERVGQRMIVQIVTDDMPFLVESVLSGISRAGVYVQRVMHPIVVVRRDGAGALVEVLVEADSTNLPRGARAESWMHIETESLTDTDTDTDTDTEVSDGLAGRITQILSDVRDVVADAAAMEHTARELAATLRADPPPLPPTEVQDGARLLEWLAEGHVTFLGYRRYELDTSSQRTALTAVLASGLGVLRGNTPSVRSFAPDTNAGERATSRQLVMISQASSISRVSRAVHPGYVSVKTFDERGTVTGEHRFLGVLTVSALYANVLDIPGVQRRVRQAIERAGFPLSSYSGQRMLEVLCEYPREQLFQDSAEELHEAAVGVLALAGRGRVRLFVRRDPYHRFFTCLVYLPRDRYSTSSRLAVQEILRRELGGSHVGYAVKVNESSVALLHVTVRTDPQQHVRPDVAKLQQQLSDAVQDWGDRVLARCSGDPDLADTVRRYLPQVPTAYREGFGPEVAVADLARLDALVDEPDMYFYTPPEALEAQSRFKLFFAGQEVALTQLLPVLQHMGVEVLEERPYSFTRPDGRRCWIYDFGLRLDEQAQATRAERGVDWVREAFCAAFGAAWRGDAEIDRFNGLVLRAGLSWQQVGLLRAYGRYQRQIGTRYGLNYLADVLAGHPRAAAGLVELFEARFDPALGAAHDQRRTELMQSRLSELTEVIDQVEALDADQILSGYVDLVTATLRTNYFARAPYLSCKIDPGQVRGMPAPVPRFEVFVYSPRMEGVHLRFGPVARGGLRWSDRPADFRTEILGLVKAQAVKNAVIVPVGAKGGFVVKRPPAPTGDPAADREALAAEGIACYRTLICGLLDVTDNLVDAQTVAPEGVVRHDRDDPYLVVAADKGTATFSDIANELALERGFWLGDAFASGGSTGYDHKAMGITAKGAWESVKRAFRELGVDTQAEPFTVVGIGDMSGDVFGNAMLLSEHIRLIAAFDHRHVFLDPDPDPAGSFAERARLFELSRCSWADYDTSLISAGGGVWSRTDKSIPLCEQIRAALGLDDDVRRLTPTELIHAILLAPADLLWNGGVGTYVKASTESHSDVGDKANNAIRVNAEALRVKVIGEGGNLGLTQRGRIEFARAGGRVNTDALDNSAGVDCSDHEVNIKIALQRVMRAGELTESDRNRLLVEMTDDVARLVLADNVTHNAVLGISRSEAPEMVSLYARLVAELESRSKLDRELEVLPTEAGFAALVRTQQGLSSPELATLLAHVKLDLKQRILDTDLPEAAVFADRLRGYFPPALRERYPDAIAEHPLRRDIITTQLVNEMVHGGGFAFAFRLAEDAVADPADAVRAYAITTEVFGLRELWADIHRRADAAELGPDTIVADRLVRHSRRLLERAARWLLLHRPQPLTVEAEISRFQPTLATLRPRIPQLLGERESTALTARFHEWLDQRVPHELAQRCAQLLNEFGLLDVVEAAELAAHQHHEPDHGESDHSEVAHLYFALSQHLRIDAALGAVTKLEPGNRWHTLARQVLRDDLYGALRAITLDVIQDSKPGEPVADKIARWEHTNASRLAQTRSALSGIGEAGLDVAALSVITRQLRGLATLDH